MDGWEFVVAPAIEGDICLVLLQVSRPVKGQTSLVSRVVFLEVHRSRDMRELAHSAYEMI
jgi:hypothetical protein